MVYIPSRQELIVNAPDRADPSTSYSSGEQQKIHPYSEQGIRGAAALAVGAGVVGGFQLAKGMGYNPWDPLYSAIRTAEEFSPGQMLRTFQAGNFISQFATQNAQLWTKTAAEINPQSSWFQDLVHRSEGRAIAALDKGLRFEKNTLFAGEEVLLQNINRMTSTGTANLAAAYSRNANFAGLSKPTSPASFRTPYVGAADPGLLENTHFVPRGILNHANALANESLERANRLAHVPFEGVEPLSSLHSQFRNFMARNFDIDPSLAVRSGNTIGTLGRMGVKWGLGVGGAYLGYQTADWAVRNFDPLNSTIFDQGITAGIGNMWAKANIAAASVVDMIPGARAYQQKQEELAPGSTSAMKVAALPIGLAFAGAVGSYASGTIEKTKILSQLVSEGVPYNKALEQSLEMSKNYVPNIVSENPASRFIINKSQQFAGFLKNLGEPGQKSIVSSVGNALGEAVGKMGRFGHMSLLGLAIGTVAVAPFIPGALLPSQTAEELQAMYSGEEEVAVRANRFWSLGTTPWEGTRIKYYRPHMVAMLNQQSRIASMDGEDEPNPISRWFQENFTYNFERQHYRDRPYPITGSAFENVPVVGPLLAATIGKIVKPQKLMHTESFMGTGSSAEGAGPGGFGSGSGGEESYLRPPGRMGSRQPQAGEYSQGAPIDPNSIKQLAGEQAYRLTELSGLTGFTFGTIKKAITGSEEFFDQEEVLQSADRAYSIERSYWDKQLGDMGASNEFLRRLIPHRRKQIAEYNPIKNLMPSWLPGAGDRAADFSRGDPFLLGEEMEARLPGAGYAARFPELKGFNPENYPLIHQYKILQDVAPYSDKTKMLKGVLMGKAKRGELTDYEMELFQETNRQAAAKKKDNNLFYDFQVFGGDEDFNIPTTEGKQQSRSSVAALNRILASKKAEKTGIAKTIIGGYWEALAKGASGPLDVLTPFSPISKMMNMRSALDQYKRYQVYGPQLAMWDSPIENFIKPAARELGDLLGEEPVPEKTQKRRSIEEYFDALEYVKNTRLAAEAKKQGAHFVAGAYERTAAETTVGINPYTRDYAALFRAIPRSERDYFSAFVGAKNQKEREEILRVAPAYMRRIYAAQWEQSYIDNLQKAMEGGLLSGSAMSAAEEDVQQYYRNREAEGFATSPELVSRFESEAEQGESYADWFRRAIAIPEIAKEEGLPGADWVGFSPGVSLNEIKLKVVQNEGMNHYDFNLWQSDERNAAMHPAATDGANQLVSSIMESQGRSPESMRQEVKAILNELGIPNAQVHVFSVPDKEETVKIDVDVRENRSQRMKAVLQQRLEEM